MALQKTDESPVGLGEHVERSPRGGFVQTRTASRAANSPTEANGTAGHTGAPARSGWRAAAGFLAVFTALLALPLQTQAQSTDAALCDLWLLVGTGSPVAMSPEFDPDTLTYTASVVNHFDTVVITLYPNEDRNVSFVVTEDDGTSVTTGLDWTSFAWEATPNLSVGSNTLTVTVTAEDNSTKTYTIVVTRAAAPPAPTDCPTDTDWCTTMRVGFATDTTDWFTQETYGYYAAVNQGDLGSTTFTHDGLDYRVRLLQTDKLETIPPDLGWDNLSLNVVPSLPGGTVLQVGTQTFTVRQGGYGTEETMDFSNPPTLTEGQELTVSLKLPAPRLTAAFDSVPEVHDGSTAFWLELEFSDEPEGLSFHTVRNDLFTVTGGTIKRAKRIESDSNRRFRLKVKPSSNGAVTLALATPLPACDEPGAVCTADGRALSGEVATTIAGPLGLSVADAEVAEAAGAVLAFAVTLDRAVLGTVTVDYATSDGTATADEDYTAASGTLTFAPSETEKTVTVAVLDDAHDEGSETLTLTLSNVSGARIADGQATGTINNSDPMPQAWLARFGRTVASQAVDAIGGRIAGGGGTHVRIGGQSLSLARESDAASEAAIVLGTLFSSNEDGDTTQSMTQRQLLLGSSFQLSAGGEAGASAWSAWGHFAAGGFAAEVDDTRLDGNVTTGFLGAHVDAGRWLGGVAFSMSEGAGDYALIDGEDRGDVESSLTALYPYARFGLTDKVDVWGLAGYGTGELTLHRNPDTDRAQTYRPDIAMRMGALGARGEVLSPAQPGGLTIAVKSDVFWVGTTSERVAGLMGSEADVSRGRLLVEGSRTFETGAAALTPSIELGLRHDAGDAETGTGIEVVAGLRYTSGAATAEGTVRTLVAHEDAGYEEWGASGTLRIDPGQSGRGLSLSLSPTWGAAASGVNRLRSLPDAHGLAPEQELDAGGRLEAQLGYGIAVTDNRGVLTTYTGLSLAEGGARTVRAGVRWNVAPGAVLGLQGTRDERSGETNPANAIRFQAELRW